MGFGRFRGWPQGKLCNRTPGQGSVEGVTKSPEETGRGTVNVEFKTGEGL